MASVRKNHTTEFKAKVAIEAIRQQKTTNELTADIASSYPKINLWKKQALAAIPGAFSGKQEKVQENLGLMRLLDKQYTRTPCHGVLKMEA